MSGSVVALFLLLLPSAPVNTQQARCENVTSGRDTGGSCSFRNQQLCGWTNVADRDQLDWQLEDNTYLGQNSYMVMDVSSASAGNVGYFASPTFCSTGSDLRSLSFRYSIELSGRCRLSVFLVTEADAVEMWSTTSATGISFSDMVDPIYFRCPGDKFQIVFAGEKLSNRRCGRYYNEIDIDDIRYASIGQSRTQGYICEAVSNVTSPPPTTVTTITTSTRGTTAPPLVSTRLPPVTGVTDETEITTQFSSNSTQPGQTRSQTDDSGGLSGGAVAGVVIAVIIVIAAVVVFIVIFLVRRRRAEAKNKTNQQPIQHGNSISNSMYMLARLHTGTGNRPDVIPSAPPHDDDTPVYNVPVNTDFTQIYSVPDDLDLPSAPSRSSQAPPGYELSTALQPPHSVAGAGLLTPAKGVNGEGLSADSCRKSGESRYNELNLRGYGPQPDAGKNGDMYDRLDEESGKETGQAGAFSAADNEYSIAYDENDSTQDPEYINSKAVSQQNNEYSLAMENSDHSLADSCNENERNEYSLAEHPGSADGVGEAQKATENEYANVQNASGGAVKNDSRKTDQYNRLDFEEFAGRRIEGCGQKVDYYNACEKDENYDHLQQGQRTFQGAGESVYRNLGFEENEYEI